MLKTDQKAAIDAAIIKDAADIRGCNVCDIPMIIRDILEKIRQFDFTCCTEVFEEAYEYAIQVVNQKINVGAE